MYNVTTWYALVAVYSQHWSLLVMKAPLTWFITLCCNNVTNSNLRCNNNNIKHEVRGCGCCFLLAHPSTDTVVMDYILWPL